MAKAKNPPGRVQRLPDGRILVTMECRVCANEFTYSTSRFAGRRRLTCSTECSRRNIKDWHERHSTVVARDKRGGQVYHRLIRGIPFIYSNKDDWQ